jgi:hypothetical protein
MYYILQPLSNHIFVKPSEGNQRRPSAVLGESGGELFNLVNPVPIGDSKIFDILPLRCHTMYDLFGGFVAHNRFRMG